MTRMAKRTILTQPGKNMTLVEKDPEQRLASAKVAARGYNKPLIISLSLLPGNLFTNEALVIPCTLGNSSEISTHSLLDTGATGVAFIDKAMARHVCNMLKISFLPLAKPKPLKGFDGKPARPITHTIYPTLTVQGHFELLAPMLVTSLGQHPIILGKPWMRKHGVILDMSCDKLTFWPGHCQHSGASVKLEDESAVPPVKELASTLKVNEPIGKEQLVNNTLKYMIPANRKAAPKAVAPKAVAPKAVASHAAPQAREAEQAKVPKIILKASSAASPCAEKPTRPLELAMVGAAPFQYLTKQKGVEIFGISMRDLEYQLNKTEKPVTDPATVVPECYHKFLDVFSKKESDKVSPHSKYDHKIELVNGGKDHGQAALRGMSKPQLEFVKKFLEENLKKGFIEASRAPCSSPILLAKKPGRGIRCCVDYRRLNKLTKKDAYPIPLIAETLAQLKGAKVFTKIDIRQAFHKLRMAASSEDLTTMATRFGAFKWKVLLFGLTGGPASWQRFINDVLWEYLNRFCTAYLNDILIYSSNLREHKEHVRLVLAKLCEFGIQADVDKCKFHVAETKYLGLIISTDGIKIDPAKVEVIQNWSTPTCVKDVRAFIGFCNFYRRFLLNFSKVAGPLNALTKKDAPMPFGWTSKCEKAFQELKQRVCKAPILCHFDPNEQCFVETNSSDYVNAGVLSQPNGNGILHPVAYFSRRMSPAKGNYEIYDKELLAIIWCFEE